MVYVDEIRDYGQKGKWCHMWADTEDELHSFAAILGLRRAWMHHSRGLVGDFKHYDLRPSKRDRALQMGAEFVPLKQYIYSKTQAS